MSPRRTEPPKAESLVVLITCIQRIARKRRFIVGGRPVYTCRWSVSKEGVRLAGRRRSQLPRMPDASHGCQDLQYPRFRNRSLTRSALPPMSKVSAAKCKRAARDFITRAACRIRSSACIIWKMRGCCPIAASFCTACRMAASAPRSVRLSAISPPRSSKRTRRESFT